VPPRPVAGAADNAPPAYPAAARRRGEQGRVLVRADVSADGAPLAVMVAQSSGHTVLDEAAVAAVRHWQFIPGTSGGQAVRAVALVPVQFRLQ
jgi:protein TonB